MNQLYTRLILLAGLTLLSSINVIATEPVVNNAQESASLIRHEKHLDRLETERSFDNKHTLQAQEDFRKGSAEMTGHAEQQARDILQLKSVENEVTAGRNQKTLDHESYNETVRQYGSEDSRSTTAQQKWKESRQAMDPLLQSRRTLKESIHDGGRLVHNEKTVLSVQKQTMNSNARYRAIDDREIKKEEKRIADDRGSLAQNVQPSDPPSSTHP